MLIEAIKIKRYIYPSPEYREKIKKNTGLYYKMNELNLLVKDNGILEIAESVEVYKKYADNIKGVYDIKLVTRKHKTIAKYWLLMQALAFHFEKSQIGDGEYKMTEKLYDLYFKRRYLGLDQIYNPLSKKSEYYDKHINYKDMPEEYDFMMYFSQVTQEVNQLGYDVDELIEGMGT